MSEGMIKILEGVQTLVQEEYERASKIHGRMTSTDHEAYALILEEFQEASEYLQVLEDKVELLWSSIRKDGHDAIKHTILKDIKRTAELVAAESVQVAQVCHKAIIMVESRNSNAEEKLYEDIHRD